MQQLTVSIKYISIYNIIQIIHLGKLPIPNNNNYYIGYYLFILIVSQNNYNLK